jgi:hypothetical protein
MSRSVPILVAISLITWSAAAVDYVLRTELIGTWQVDPTSFYVRSRAIPNAFPRPQFPTNFLAFELHLKEDGSFVAKNVPARFFFEGDPALRECCGSWLVRTNWALLLRATRSQRSNDWVFPPGPNATNGYSDLVLSYKLADVSWRSWSSPIDRSRALPFGPWEDRKSLYEWGVMVKKQRSDEKR